MNSLKYLLVCFLAGCGLLQPEQRPPSEVEGLPPPVVTQEVVPGVPQIPTAASPVITPTENPYPWTDEIPTMFGICFQAALDAADQVFVLRSAEEHIRFYDLADNSQLCSRPVERTPFNFDAGDRVLAGLWSDGIGCRARHDVLDYAEIEGTLRIDLQFVIEGDCNYELVRPYWIGVDGVGNVEITVSE